MHDWMSQLNYSGFGFFFFKFGIWAESQVLESGNFQTFQVWFTNNTVIKEKPVFIGPILS